MTFHYRIAPDAETVRRVGSAAKALGVRTDELLSDLLSTMYRHEFFRYLGYMEQALDEIEEEKR